MKRTDKHWKSWGFSCYSPNGWWVFHTPAGSFGIDHHRSVTEQGISRGRRKEWELRIPLTKNWQIPSGHPRQSPTTQRALHARLPVGAQARLRRGSMMIGPSVFWSFLHTANPVGRDWLSGFIERHHPMRQPEWIGGR